jgi:hypothetical protein
MVYAAFSPMNAKKGDEQPDWFGKSCHIRRHEHGFCPESFMLS